MARSARIARVCLALGIACAAHAPVVSAREPEVGGPSPGERAEELARERCDERASTAPEACADARLAAARAYRKTGSLAKAIGMARSGLAWPGASLATRTALATELGDGYAGVALFAEAASAYAVALEGATGAVDRGALLQNVVPIWFALGSEAEAAREVATFVRRFPDAPASGLLVLGIVQRAVEQERFRDALAASKWGAERTYPVDVSVQLALLEARATRALHHDERHVALAQAVVHAAGDAATLPQRLRSAHPDDDEAFQLRRLARVLSAVGEARFMVAEAQQRNEVDALRVPTFHGGTGVEAFASATLRPWMEKKRAAIEAASRAYAAVLEVQPAPPPRWVVAAGRAVGLMWGTFVDELDALGARHAASKGFRDAVRAAAEPYRSGHARPAMQACVAYPAKLQWVDPGVRDCERWLVRHYPGAVVPVEERVPALVAGQRPSPRSLPPAPPLRPASP